MHDDAFYNPWPTRPAIDAVMSAYRDSGLRATVAINHQNRPELDKLPFLAEILPADIRAEVDAIRIAPLDGAGRPLPLVSRDLAWRGEWTAAHRRQQLRAAARHRGLLRLPLGVQPAARPAVQHPCPRDQNAAGAGHSNGSANRSCAWWTISDFSISECW